MAAKNSIRPLASVFFNTALLIANPQPMLPAGGLPRSCFLIRLVNLSNVPVFFSYNNNDLHEVVPAGQTVTLPGFSNAKPGEVLPMFARGMQFSVFGVAGIGNIYLVGYFQDMV